MHKTFLLLKFIGLNCDLFVEIMVQFQKKNEQLMASVNIKNLSPQQTEMQVPSPLNA